MSRKNAPGSPSPSPRSPRSASSSPRSPLVPKPPSRRRPQSAYAGSRLPAYNNRLGRNSVIPRQPNHKYNVYFHPRPPAGLRPPTAFRGRNKMFSEKTLNIPNGNFVLRSMTLSQALNFLKKYSEAMARGNKELAKKMRNRNSNANLQERRRLEIKYRPQ